MEPTPSGLPPVPSYHPAPQSGWRPMSGLAVTSFVLSLVFILIAVPGIWLSELLPLGLGVLTLFTVKATERRGRVLAVWGIVIAVGVGSCSYAMHNGARSLFGGIAESLLSAVSSKATDEEKDAALKPWIYGPALEKNPELLAAIRGRYAAVEAKYGPYQGEVDLGTPYLGVLPLFMKQGDVQEVGTGEEPGAWTPGAVIWVRARFERAKIVTAIVLLGGDGDSREQMAELEPSGQAPIVGDLRFYEPRAEAGK